MSKLSSYELINYIFLGGLAFILGISIEITFFIEMVNIITSIGGYLQIAFYFIFIYFLGILISRVGSFIESALKTEEKNRSKFLIQYSHYSDYIIAEKNDPKISVLATQVNLYRSLFGLFMLLFMLILVEEYFNAFFSNYEKQFLILVLAIIFYFSWRKQVKYVRERVEKSNNMFSRESNKDSNRKIENL